MVPWFAESPAATEGGEREQALNGLFGDGAVVVADTDGGLD
jgi:hypothetical protein